MAADVCSAVAAASWSAAAESLAADCAAFELSSLRPATRCWELSCQAARAPVSWPISSWRAVATITAGWPWASWLATLARRTMGLKVIRNWMKASKAMSTNDPTAPAMRTS